MLAPDFSASAILLPPPFFGLSEGSAANSNSPSASRLAFSRSGLPSSPRPSSPERRPAMLVPTFSSSESRIARSLDL
jgi:hypothetical protein